MLKRVILPILVSILLLFFMCGARFDVGIASNSVIRVPENFSTIQGAINTASPGDIIPVSAGTYHGLLNVNKMIQLIGEDPNATIIDGDEAGTVITITASDVQIRGFTIKSGKSEEPFCGILVYECYNVTISNNLIKENYNGIDLRDSNSCIVFSNTITNNLYAGIKVFGNNNNFYDNIIANNTSGVLISGSTTPNTFYHNNFINNKNQVLLYAQTVWDNGAEGNYWSDYVGTDADMDGVGNSEYQLVADRYPLMGMFTNFAIQHKSQRYLLSTICNSTISNFHFEESNKKISFDVSGQNDTIGFCRIAIPTTLAKELWQGDYTVLIDSNSTTHIRKWVSSVYNYSYFTHEHLDVARKVTIAPGFEEDIVFPLIMTTTLIVIVILIAVVLILRKRRKF